MITLQITRREKDKNYEENLQKWKDEGGRYSMKNSPIEWREDILTVEITEEQFKAIRKELLKEF